MIFETLSDLIDVRKGQSRVDETEDNLGVIIFFWRVWRCNLFSLASVKDITRSTRSKNHLVKASIKALVKALVSLSARSLRTLKWQRVIEKKAIWCSL